MVVAQAATPRHRTAPMAAISKVAVAVVPTLPLLGARAEVVAGPRVVVAAAPRLTVRIPGLAELVAMAFAA